MTSPAPSADVRLEPLTLVGRTVRLEPLAAEHADELWAAGSDPAIAEFSLAPRSRGEMDDYIAAALREQELGTALPFVVRHVAEGRLIGSTRYLDFMPEHRGLEIGYTWYHPRHWRTAVNTECKYLLLGHAFDVLRCIRVQFKTSARNLRSRAAIARLGAVEEGTLRSNRILPDGSRRDSVYFSILDHEWPAVRARLEAALAR